MRELTIQFTDEETLPERIEAYAAHHEISVDHAIHRLLIKGLDGFGLRELSDADYQEAQSLEELFERTGITKPKN